MYSPLFDKLEKYKAQKRYPWHMPGHKQGRGLKYENILAGDITEIAGFDNLHNPNGVILESQKLCAETFGADKSFFLINGSSAGLSAITMSFGKSKIICSRNCHKSVHNGFVLGGGIPVYIKPEFFYEYGFCGSISPLSVENALKNNLDAAAVVITSPTYEGIASDIENIANIVHSYNKPLIVDEAHGAHFKFGEIFPKTALECGADAVVQSVHKTLPSMTQTALLHLKGNRINADRLKSYISIMQSTSPSYILMSSIDICCGILRERGKELFEEYQKNIVDFRNRAQKLNNIKLIDKSIIGNAAHDIDLGKLVFCTENAPEACEILLDKYNQDMEMSGERHFIAMTSLADDGYDSFIDALYSIDDMFEPVKGNLDFDIEIPEMAIYPRDAAFMNWKYIDVSKSAGKISADFVTPYPPGIPVLCPGEVITEGIVYKMLNSSNSVMGLCENRLIKVID